MVAVLRSRSFAGVESWKQTYLALPGCTVSDHCASSRKQLLCKNSELCLKNCTKTSVTVTQLLILVFIHLQIIFSQLIVWHMKGQKMMKNIFPVFKVMCFFVKLTKISNILLHSRSPPFNFIRGPNSMPLNWPTGLGGYLYYLCGGTGNTLITHTHTHTLLVIVL